MLKLPMISTELVSEMIQHVDPGMIFYIYLLFLGVGLKIYVTHEPLANTPFKPTNNVAHVGSFERSHNATSRSEWLVVATLPNKKTNSFPLKMVIFHNYISLPEGIYIYIPIMWLKQCHKPSQ